MRVDYTAFSGMTMQTPQDKGDALENAVAAIEEVILRSSARAGTKAIVEKKKIITVEGVRHEIEVYVTVDLAPGYKPVYIFECKNWKEAVGKNEIIVFSEKINPARATSGCFVAKSYTHAVGQAKKDPGITLLLVAEHDPAGGDQVFQFFTRTPEMTKLDVTMFKLGGTGLNATPISQETSELRCSGKLVSLQAHLFKWSLTVCEKDLKAFFEQAVPAGVYHRVVDQELRFKLGQVSIRFCFWSDPPGFAPSFGRSQKGAAGTACCALQKKKWDALKRAPGPEEWRPKVAATKFAVIPS
jgi:hypothetical protein